MDLNQTSDDGTSASLDLASSSSLHSLHSMKEESSDFPRNLVFRQPSDTVYSETVHTRTTNANLQRQHSEMSSRSSALAENATVGVKQCADPVGLQVLHEPTEPPVADLVFVHSLGGGSRWTWSSSDREDTFWPHDWLPKETSFGATRIMTYGFSSQRSTLFSDRLLDFSDFAKDLLAKLRFGTGREDQSLNVGTAPIIFIAHSLGGLIAKKAFLLASSDPNSTYGDIAQATSAFVFFSTPHRGLYESTVIGDILSACVEGWHLSSQHEFLHKQTPKLQEINDRFRDAAIPFDIYSFYERVPTRFPNTTEHFLLPQQLVTLDHPSETQIPVDSDHLSITKYNSRTDPKYASVRGAIRSLIDKFSFRKRSAFVEDTSSQIREVDELLQGYGAPQDDLILFSDKRIEGTCEWVFNHPTMDVFLQDESPSPQILWCFGGPGSGKSVTTAYIIERLLESSRPCAYYYFRSGHQVKNGLVPFLGSVASQMSRCVPEYRRKLLCLARDHFDVGKAGHKLLWRKLFVSTLLQCGPARPCYLVVDGLDELAQSRELLTKLFVELGHAATRIRLILISRPTLEIEASLEKLSKRVQVQRMALDDNGEDLAMYVREEMDSMMGDESFKSRTLHEVLSKAGGNFLWAHLVVQEIMGCQTEIQVENAIQQVPKDLEPLYRRMDSRLADTFLPRPQDKEMGHMVIKWAACARRPLHLNEIKTALEYNFPRILDMRQTVHKLCGGFVIVDAKGSVSMMHASAREFLTTNPELQYHVNGPEAHHTLFNKCAQALLVGNREHDGVRDQGQAFVEYSASSWPFHLTQSMDHKVQESLAAMGSLLERRTALEWIFRLAHANELRSLVDASHALVKLLKAVNKADMERSPLVHRLGDKDLVQMWAQDLIRIVGSFGVQLTKHPNAVFRLMPAFCPPETVIHRQFGPGSPTNELLLRVRGNISPAWDDCFAKFVVATDSLPHRILSLDRYFAILTQDNGTVQLYYSATCEFARKLCHGRPVSTFCADFSTSRIATYGLQKTSVWAVESGRLLFSIDNPPRTKALAMTFQQNDRGDDILMIFSEDRVIRSCSLDHMRIQWREHGAAIGNDPAHLHHANSPYTAQFNAEGHFLAVSYRGANPAVWSVGTMQPRFVRHCDHRARKTSGEVFRNWNYSHVRTFSWNPLTGHLLGAFEDGVIFRWHPREDDFAQSDVKCMVIKCSADGKFFVTGSGDGLLRIWDFDHFEPVYQLRHPGSIQDIEISCNEARVYDLRDQYCNIWEPNSLLRALEGDDTYSDSQSIKGSEQSSLASEAVLEDFEPVTAIVCINEDSLYAFGNDSGQITIANFDGKRLLTLDDSVMSNERLEWNQSSNRLASVDLSWEIKVYQFGLAVDDGQPRSDLKPMVTFSETEEIQQTLFDYLGEKLLVVTPTRLRVHRVSGNLESSVVPAAFAARWTQHPLDRSFALGFTATGVNMMRWDDPLDVYHLQYGTDHDKAGVPGSRPAALLNARRPSEAYPASPSEVNRTVNKVFFSPNTRLAIIDIIGTTAQTQRRTDCLLLDTKFLVKDSSASSVPVWPIPSQLMEVLHVSLGFVDADKFGRAQRRSSLTEQAWYFSQRREELSTFIFVDKEFWLCSIDLMNGIEQVVEIRRHFFLPRNWQSTEWLEMAVVTASGNFLCPRNGEVAVVSDGFSETFVD